MFYIKLKMFDKPAIELTGYELFKVVRSLSKVSSGSSKFSKDRSVLDNLLFFAEVWSEVDGVYHTPEALRQGIFDEIFSDKILMFNKISDNKLYIRFVSGLTWTFKGENSINRFWEFRKEVNNVSS